ncbi:MAG: acyltransferase [Proteobacteria bacterium]|nr:acyltransferase [Pseudomonadota bacterium]
MNIGPHSIFSNNSRFGNPENIEIGDYVYIGPEAYFWGKGGIRIGNNISFGPRTAIHTINHRWENATSIPYDGCSIMKPVSIRDNCWIGGHSIILPGVTIGEGSIVAMGAVVINDVPPLTVVGGNPAYKIKNRDENHYNEMKEKGMFWHKLNQEGKIRYLYVTGDEADLVDSSQVIKM